MLEKLDGKQFAKMVQIGARHLSNNAKNIDALNVFPVPDGDTGTNMNLSMTSGAKEVKQTDSHHISDVTKALSKGLLMGARGNSGVILSQIFRGFAKGAENETVLTTKGLAKAFEEGVHTAYKAVMKPVEGTILTVAKDAALKASELAETQTKIIPFMEAVVAEAKASLNRTPDLLPVLKEVGVVDSGGQGLVTIYEGFLAALKGEDLAEEADTIKMEELINAEHHKINQEFMDTSDIVYGYCTEFMVKFEADKLEQTPFDEAKFREELSKHGDSLLVASDDEIVKVHVHVEYPGEVLTIGQQYGSLINMKIENMREQHAAILREKNEDIQSEVEKKPYAVVAVAMGSGIKELFENLGATVVIEGGQTMNPSTQDITEAIKKANAHNIIILPNNKNIVMTAEQARDLTEDNVAVVKTKTIPQGISALLAFHPDVDIKTNHMHMTEAMEEVKTGQVTYAVRDTKIDGMLIKKGNYMGILDGSIKSCEADRFETVKGLLQELITEDDEILTILYGEDVTDSEVKELTQFVEEKFDDIEIEVHHGNQPIYSYILSVE